MEKFEIDKNGCLTAYHNDNRNVTEIIIPDGVKCISHFVFQKYKEIYSVTFLDSLESTESSAFWNVGFPSHITSVELMKYRGVKFQPGGSCSYIDEIIDMIANKDFSKNLPDYLKRYIIIQIYLNDGDSTAEAYIKKNFRKIFLYLRGQVIFEKESGHSGYIENAMEIIEKLIRCGKFITKRNINTYIKYADEMECYEVFDMLNEYREENNF